MKKLRNCVPEPPVKWLSDVYEAENSSEKFYTKFQFQSVTASVGDFVLVLNADAIDADTVEGSDVAKILRLYESETNENDPYRAVVQWYSRVRELPKKVTMVMDGCPALSQQLDVVQETRPFDNDISVETVFRTCRVMFAPPDKDPAEVVHAENSSVPVFVCRFRLVCRGLRNRFLEPLSTAAEVESSNCDLIQRKASRCNDDVAPVSTVTPDKPKLKTPRRVRLTEGSTSDSNEEGIIQCSKGERLSKLSSSKDITKSGDKRNVSKSGGLRSSGRKRTVNKLIEYDSDEDFKYEQRTLAKKRNKLHSNKGSSSKKRLSNREHLTPSGSTSRGGESNRLVSARRVRRKLSIELEEGCVSQNEDSSAGSNSDGDVKQPTCRRKGSQRKAVEGMPRRGDSVSTPSTPLEAARSRLHVSAVPRELPCREAEFESVYHFVRCKLLDSVGGCMYISGVPGTGKTATVHEVLRSLQKEVDEDNLPQFTLVKINGMQLTEPRQAYVEILHQLTGQKMKSQQAQQILEKRFKTPAPRRTMTVLVVDELDLLSTRRQDVVYSLLDWPNYASARLVVITIANTMDLPERSFINRVNSRMGLTRVTFQPYTYTQLQEIVMSRLEGLNAFHPDAVQLIARKVAAVSGDARRALDMCRRATEVSSSSNDMVTMSHVNQVLQEMITSPKIQAIRSCSVLEQAFLRATAAEVCRTGVEETTFSNVYHQLYTLCLIDNLTKPSISQAFGLCARLGACRLLIAEHSKASTYQRIILNVSTDDIHYASSQHV